MKISIIIPLGYGVDPILIISKKLLNIFNFPFELIFIIDDDRVYDLSLINRQLQKFTKQNHYFSFILYRTLIRSGPGNARNLGLNLATGEWILFLDSDDYLLIDKFDLTLLCNDKSDFIILNFIDQDNFMSNNILVDSIDPIILHNSDVLIENIIYSGYFPNQIQQYLIKKSYLVDFELKFDPIFIHEDLIFCYKLIINSRYFQYVNLDFYFYTSSPFSTKKLSSLDRALDVYYCLYKYFLQIKSSYELVINVLDKYILDRTIIIFICRFFNACINQKASDLVASDLFNNYLNSHKFIDNYTIPTLNPSFSVSYFLKKIDFLITAQLNNLKLYNFKCIYVYCNGPVGDFLHLLISRRFVYANVVLINDKEFNDISIKLNKDDHCFIIANVQYHLLSKIKVAIQSNFKLIKIYDIYDIFDKKTIGYIFSFLRHKHHQHKD